MGGLHAVMYTEAIQAIVLLLGSFVLMLFGLKEVGGWGNLMKAVPATNLNMFRPLVTRNIRGWASYLRRRSWVYGIGARINILYRDVWLQKNETEARRGTILPPFKTHFFLHIPDTRIDWLCLIYARKITIADEWGWFHQFQYHLSHDGKKRSCRSDWEGLLAGGLLAALMSSLASVYNACSILYTIDIYKKGIPEASEAQLVGSRSYCHQRYCSTRYGLDTGNEKCKQRPLRLSSKCTELPGSTYNSGFFVRRFL